MKFKTILFLSTIIMILEACCKDDSQNANQIGRWKVGTTETIFTNSIQTNQYNSEFQLTLNTDNTGTYEWSGLNSGVNWYLDKKHNKLFLSILFTGFGSKSFRNTLFDIHIDEASKQVWEHEQIFLTFPANDTQKTVEIWNLQKQ